MFKKIEVDRLASRRSCITVVAVVGLTLVLLATGCDQSGSGLKSEGTPSNPVTLTVGVTHSGSVGRCGISFYRFTTTDESEYTIALTNTQSDLSWDLYDSSWSHLMECDDHYHAADEIATTPVLPAGTTYHLAVEEWDCVAGRFTLLVSTGVWAGPRNEGSFSDPLVLTVGVIHSGMVGQYGTSYYRFTTTVLGSYTISLTDTQSDLSWDLYDSNWSHLMECDDHWHAADEIATTPVLPAGTTYHLTVDEWDGVVGRFELLITAP